MVVFAGRPAAGGEARFSQDVVLPHSFESSSGGAATRKPLPRSPEEVVAFTPLELDGVAPYVEDLEWWGKPSQEGRRPFDTSAPPELGCPVWIVRAVGAVVGAQMSFAIADWGREFGGPALGVGRSLFGGRLLEHSCFGDPEGS